jgi:AcrR family transcriptional regulator
MAFALFVDRGYEETTVEDICAVAGISRSTFFRYFPSKEEVLMGEAAVAGEQVLARLRERPDDETPWMALRRSLSPMLEHYDSAPERSLSLAKLVTGNPVLAARTHEKRLNWHRMLGPEVARRLGLAAPDPADPRPAALISAALACLDAAVEAWAAGGGKPALTGILDRAMDSFDDAR